MSKNICFAFDFKFQRNTFDEKNWHVISLKVILLTCIIFFKKVDLLLQEGVEQQTL